MSDPSTTETILARVRERNTAFLDHSIVNSSVDAIDRAFLLDLLDARDAEIKRLREFKWMYKELQRYTTRWKK